MVISPLITWTIEGSPHFVAETMQGFEVDNLTNKLLVTVNLAVSISEHYWQVVDL